MTDKITKLTAEQEARLVEFREEWLRVGMCCDPADFDAGDEVIRGFYARLNKPAPLILHFSSPAMCELAANLVNGFLKEPPQAIRGQLRDQLGNELRNQLGNQLWDQLRNQLRNQLGNELRSQLWNQLWNQLGDQLVGQLGDQLRGQLEDELKDQLWNRLVGQLGIQLWNQLRIQLKDQLGNELGDQFRGQLRDQLWDQRLADLFLRHSFDNQYNVAWGAFYMFGHEIGVEYKATDWALMLEWARLFKSVGWWAPFDGVCFVSDRPRKVQFDAEKRLHCETGKAVKYSDGWGVSAWHGTRVPDEWLADRKALTPQIALTWQNVDQRAAACEILGWANIIAALNPRVIDEDADPQIGRLIEVDLPDHGPQKFIHAWCGTGREIAVMADRNAKTIIEAQAASYGLKASDFQIPEVRT